MSYCFFRLRRKRLARAARHRQRLELLDAHEVLLVERAQAIDLVFEGAELLLEVGGFHRAGSVVP